MRAFFRRCNRLLSLCSLRLTTRDEQSGIMSITCEIYDATIKHIIWTTTQGARRLPRAHTEHVQPEGPETVERPERPEIPERLKRVRHQNWRTSDNMLRLTCIYTVSQKNCAKLFCQNFVKFKPIFIIFGRKIAKRPKFCEVYSFSTSSNSRHHTTVLNADVPNCYTTLKVVICNKLSNNLINIQ